MASIHITRAHHLSFQQAKAIAKDWQKGGEERYSLECDYQQVGDTEGDAGCKDVIGFKRSGVSGTLTTTATEFVLDAKLGFLFSAFKERIENEIHENLDRVLSKD